MPTEILQELWGNWMFRVSLSSNELFHSNFLHTLFSDPDAPNGDTTDWNRLRQCAESLGLNVDWQNQAYRDYGQYSVYVYREWKKLDLAFVVRIPDKRGSYKEVVIFALELKIKSYPTLEQLDRYISNMNDHNKQDGYGSCSPQLVLLSLAGAPPKVVELSQLVLVEFGPLAKSLRDLRSDQSALRPALDAYILLCEQLHELSKHWRRMLEEPLELKDILQRGVPYCRLGAIWFKLCASRLCVLVAEKIGTYTINKNVELKLTPGLSNSTWSADFLWVRSDLAKETPRSKNAASHPAAKVGVQVEGDTIRFMMNASNIRPRTSCARKEVEKTLLAQARKQGLFSRLMEVYAHSNATGTTTVSGDRLTFWQHRGVLLERSGWPRLSRPRNPEFDLTGYENNAMFGHADYRLKLENSNARRHHSIDRSGTAWRF